MINMLKKVIRFIYYKIMKIFFKDRSNMLETKAEFEHFAGKYCRYANINSKMDIAHVCAELRILTHVVEKALTLPNVRAGFGKEKIENIVALLHMYEEYGDDSFDYEAYENGIKILKTYASYKDEYKLNIDSIDAKYLLEGEESDLGVLTLGDDEKNNRKKLPFDEFALSRHSIRAYANKDISDEDILNIVKLAQTAPSACNRQDVKVICVKNPDKVKKLMEMHQGAKGFGMPSCVMLVVSDLRMYGKYEMSLPYFDGGLFTMNLLYAIHYYGFGSCPLIWEDFCNGKMIRDIVDIPDYFMVNVLIPVGEMPDIPIVAVSKKRTLKNIVEII